MYSLLFIFITYLSVFEIQSKTYQVQVLPKNKYSIAIAAIAGGRGSSPTASVMHIEIYKNYQVETKLKGRGYR